MRLGRQSVDVIIRAILTIFHCFTQKLDETMLVQSVTKRPMCQYVTLRTLARLNDITQGGRIEQAGDVSRQYLGVSYQEH